MPVRAILGFVLIVAGALIILSRLDVFYVDWEDLWPLVLIFIGIVIIIRAIQRQSAKHIIGEKKEIE